MSRGSHVLFRQAIAFWVAQVARTGGPKTRPRDGARNSLPVFALEFGLGFRGEGKGPPGE